MASIVTAFAVLSIMAIGFYILIGGPRRWGLRQNSGPVSTRERPRLEPGPLRDGVNTLVTVGLVFRFFGSSAMGGVIDQNTAATAIVAVLVGLALIPDLQLLVGIAALAVLFIERGNMFAGPLLGAFAFGGIAHVLLRKLLKR